MVLHTSHLDWDEIIRVSAHCNHRGFAASELCMPSSVHYWNLSLTQLWPLVPNAFMNEQKSSWNVEQQRDSVCVNLCFVHTFNQHYYASKQEGNLKRGPFLQNKYRVLQLNWYPTFFPKSEASSLRNLSFVVVDKTDKLQFDDVSSLSKCCCSIGSCSY